MVSNLTPYDSFNISYKLREINKPLISLKKLLLTSDYVMTRSCACVEQTRKKYS